MDVAKRVVCSCHAEQQLSAGKDTCNLRWRPPKRVTAAHRGKKYFLAGMLENCDEACSKLGRQCDLSGLEILDDWSECKHVVKKLGKVWFGEKTYDGKSALS